MVNNAEILTTTATKDTPAEIRFRLGTAEQSSACVSLYLGFAEHRPRQNFCRTLINNLIPSRRAQTVFLDLFFAVGFFLMLIGLVLVTSMNLKYQAGQNLIRDDLEREAIIISDLFVQSPGYPTGWEINRSAVETFGLAGADHQIVFDKAVSFKKLTDSNYTRTKQILAIEDDEFFMQIRYQNGTIAMTTGNITPAGHVVDIRRAVTYRNSNALLIFALWRSGAE